MLLVICQSSCDVIGYGNLRCHWCISIHLLSQFNSRLLLVKLSVVQSLDLVVSFAWVSHEVILCTMPVTVDYDSNQKATQILLLETLFITCTCCWNYSLACGTGSGSSTTLSLLRFGLTPLPESVLETAVDNLQVSHAASPCCLPAVCLHTPVDWKYKKSISDFILLKHLLFRF